MRLSPAAASRVWLAAFATLLGGCAGASSTVSALPRAPDIGAQLWPSAVREKILNSLTGYPQADLLYVGGALYGTTLSGGTYSHGTVFKVTKAGKETILHSFGHGADGENPTAPLIDLKGTLYGTTAAGGSGKCSGSTYSGCGTVFKITTSGKESVVYSFKSGSDGQAPRGGMVDLNGTLYGTTILGGGSNLGTVFKMTPARKESVLYSFKGGNDGVGPYASLTDVKGKLYGVTYGGGADGFGTVFKITTTGSENVIYTFLGYSNKDGQNPWASLIYVNGTLYGTALYGGSFGDGAVFKVSTSGKEMLLHSFTGDPDGASPLGALVYPNGALYGTTYFGGSQNLGAIFETTTSGKESVVYSFLGGSNGGEPYAGMIYVKPSFYGTTEYPGTVFSLTL